MHFSLTYLSEIKMKAFKNHNLKKKEEYNDLIQSFSILVLDLE